ncbi:hypothetical protein ACTJIJ_18535 [Niabella sp. 22666]|uniref:hypothetical protein n=1 Tax=Niabella sp. 22666 TaxID=3453954 RepID=UPI003F861ABF
MYKINGYILALLLVLLLAGCKKEAVLQPSNKDENNLVVKDNPADPVDHAIYQFFQATGVPIFYNDTIARQQVGDSAGIPRYSFQKLSIAYSITGYRTRGITFKLLPRKEVLLPLLPLLKGGFLSRAPLNIPIYSLLIVERMQVGGSLNNGISTIMNKPYAFLNTLMLPIINPDTMTVASRRSYIAEVLTAFAYQKLLPGYSKQIDDSFHSITKKSYDGELIYIQPLSSLSPDGSKQLEDFGFIETGYSSTLILQEYTPLPQDDLLSYLYSVFFYDTVADFESRYANHPLVLQKFKVIRDIVKQMGFRFAN